MGAVAVGIGTSQARGNEARLADHTGCSRRWVSKIGVVVDAAVYYRNRDTCTRHPVLLEGYPCTRCPHRVLIELAHREITREVVDKGKRCDASEVLAGKAHRHRLNKGQTAVDISLECLELRFLRGRELILVAKDNDHGTFLSSTTELLGQEAITLVR